MGSSRQRDCMTGDSRSTASANSRESTDAVTYRGQLRAVVAASAAPHGYTLTIWTCGAITCHAQGSLPSAVDAVALLVGATLGFAVVGLAAFGRLDARLSGGSCQQMRLWGSVHLLSVGLSILLVWCLTEVVHGIAVWPLVGFVATSTYQLAAAAQFWLASGGSPTASTPSASLAARQSAHMPCSS